MKLDIRELKLSLGDFRLSCDLDLPSGRLITLLGPSGCGKTSLLKSVAGLVDLVGGSIRLGEREISGLDPRDRKIGMVFQDYALFPHMSVRKNICYGMPLKGEAAAERCRELLALVELDGFEERMPDDLSGGEKQRVALARALAGEPDILLLDEPLSALDARLRRLLRRQIREIQTKTGITTLYVTHDQEEAMAISDWIVLMERGRVCQTGSPEELYRKPANAFAGRFIGNANMIPVRRAQAVPSGPGVPEEALRLETSLGEISLPPALAASSAENTEGPEGFLYFRPEDCRLEPPAAADLGGEGTVVYREYGGDFLLLELKSGAEIVRIKAPAEHPAALGERLFWRLRAEDGLHLK